MNYSFTIFTPCYNGEKTIERVFESVASQTYTNFEWIIINDGSKDNSDIRIKELMNKYPELKGKIKYLNENNAGKHIAWNKAVKMAENDFFLSADCDDSFMPETLLFFNNKANEICNNNFLSSMFSGINVCCYDPLSNMIIGDKYPEDGMVTDNIELEYKYHVRGEHWGIVRTDLLKQIEFPKVSGHFYNESYLWFTLALNYRLVCYNVSLRAYYTETNSLVHNKNYKFDKKRSFMELHFNWWRLTHIGKRIFRYSKKGFIETILILIKTAVKVCISK